MVHWAILILVSVCAAAAVPYMKSTVTSCLWHNNSCVEKCPDWMVVKKSDCNEKYWKALKTCANPEEMLVGTVCGFARCDCPGTTVLDTDTGYCYEVDNCPTIHDE